jgi:DNA/RNA-binding domain of Phe-tRNA-synthetase-like protein
MTSDVGELEAVLASAYVEASVLELRPDYRALLIAVDGITPEGSDAAADDIEALVVGAESAARVALGRGSVEDIAHVAAWRDAYRAFGAKPQRTRNSLESLLRRAGEALPRVNPLTDLYNAISVLHQVPIGGEDLSCYVGSPRLVRAGGAERFDTVAEGIHVTEHPEAGEVVWCDAVGVTCRRWNWRQGSRTRLTDASSSALFILDALDPMTDGQLVAAADDLVHQLTALGPHVVAAQRLIASPATPH